MNIWQKLKGWAKKDRNMKGVTPPPVSRAPSDAPSSRPLYASPTKKYANGKLRVSARRGHEWNRRERLKDPADTHRQKCRKLGLS